MKKLLLGLLSLSLSACVSYPENVQVAEGTNLVSYTDVVESSAHIKQLARWSGVIAEVTNHKETTQLDILYYPASGDGRPKTDEEPLGRFRVYSDTFLDPAIYKQGKSITALGTIAKKEMAKIGDFEYEYPTLVQSKIYLWKKQQPRTKVQFDYGFYGHPRYYWNGGARHIYIIGKDKPAPNHGTKKSKNRT
ncbi:Slp family lipoprotein [Psychrosphaera sp. B3R10]|uniref:Slp family lipoprotein n=1 Tax=unclassified Psychrosphaera TaxID=2641570 RepID=UPI001C088D1C|nr:MULTISPECIES: Slp family lipoprotein [unclassified Psychrosphaera]MBU2883831.1 Slp family lipoprotein [Psychrosphaera sp. I2R16]MBU2989659.1 Slp family lipoprotein [Psychrosphaera sp. B3R10]